MSTTDSLSSALTEIIDAAIYAALETDAKSITYFSALGLAFEGLVLGAVLSTTYRYYEHFAKHDSKWTLTLVALGLSGCIGQFGLNLWQTYLFIDKAATMFYMVLAKDIYADMTVLLFVGIYNFAGAMYFSRRTVKLIGHWRYVGVPLGIMALGSLAMCLLCVSHGFNMPSDSTHITTWLNKMDTYVIAWMAMSLVSDVAVCGTLTYALLRTKTDIEAAASSLWKKLVMLTFETMIPSATVVLVLLVYGSVKNATFGNFTRALAWLLGPLYFLAIVHSLVSRHDVQYILQHEVHERHAPPPSDSEDSSHDGIHKPRKTRRTDRGPILPTHIAQFASFSSEPEKIEDTKSFEIKPRRRERQQQLQMMEAAKEPMPLIPIDLDARAKKELGFGDDNEFGVTLA